MKALPSSHGDHLGSSRSGRTNFAFENIRESGRMKHWCRRGYETVSTDSGLYMKNLWNLCSVRLKTEGHKKEESCGMLKIKSGLLHSLSCKRVTAANGVSRRNSVLSVWVCQRCHFLFLSNRRLRIKDEMNYVIQTPSVFLSISLGRSHMCAINHGCLCVCQTVHKNRTCKAKISICTSRHKRVGF